MGVAANTQSEGLAVSLLQRRTAPELVLWTTRDIPKLLYSEISRDWLWDYLRTLSLPVAPSIHTENSLPKLLFRVKESVLAAVASVENAVEAMMTLKVAIALISRNAIRLSKDDLVRFVTGFEQMFDMRGQKLSELLFYSLLIVVSLFDDYSIVLSIQSVLSKMDQTLEGRRLKYCATSIQAEKRWKDLLQEICDAFEFPINMPEGYLAQSCEKVIQWATNSRLSVEEMDEKCLVIYIREGGTDVSWQHFTASFTTSTDLHFCALLDCVVALRLRVLDQELLRLLSANPSLSHRVLLYVLLYNSFRDVPKYPRALLFSIDVRQALQAATGIVRERLLILALEQLPYYFLPRFVAFEGHKPHKSTPIPGLQKLEKLTSAELMAWKEAMYWSPLSTLMDTLDVIAPESSKQDFELLNPLRVFKADGLFSSAVSTEMTLWLLEVSVAVWEHFVVTYRTPGDARVCPYYILLMVLTTQQSACAQQLISKLGVSEPVDALICEFLHCFWIENPILIRLVHMQGYDYTHIGTMVQRVDSLICTWDFLEEMLKDGNQEKQIFALLLSGYMAQKYPTQRMLDILRSCLQFLEENGSSFWDSATLDSVLDMYLRTFAQLTGRIKEVRKKLRRNLFSYPSAVLAMVR